jgi:hypothetical protein
VHGSFLLRDVHDALLLLSLPRLARECDPNGLAIIQIASDEPAARHNTWQAGFLLLGEFWS